MYKEQDEQQEGEVIRVKTPHGREVLGVVEQRLGGSRVRVRCLDGNTRVCRIPGRLKIKLWVREGDTVLVEPWELSQKDKGDILFKYKRNQVEWLKQKGFLKDIEGFDEF